MGFRCFSPTSWAPHALANQEHSDSMPPDHHNLSALDAPDADDAEAQRQRRATRENAKRGIRERGIGEMLHTLNRNALQGRRWFEEHDSRMLFKLCSAYTRPHIWVDPARQRPPSRSACPKPRSFPPTAPPLPPC